MYCADSVLHICLVTSVYPPVVDGFSTYTRDLAVTLTKLGQSVTVLWVDFEGVPPGHVLDRYESGVRVVHLHPLPNMVGRMLSSATGVAQLGRSYDIYRLIKKYHVETPFDVVEFSNWHAPAAIHSLFKLCPQVVRVTTSILQIDLLRSASGARAPSRDEELRAAKRIARLEAWSIGRSDLIITPTTGHWRDVSERIALDRSDERISIIPFGINLCGRDEKLWSASGENICRILYVGRLSHRKGFDVFMAAISHIVRNARTEISFTVIGEDVEDLDGRSTWQLLSSCLDPDIAGCIRYLGRVSDEERETNYRLCDVFVAPSRYESFGLIYIEAMSYGIPAVGSRVGGVPEVVEDGVTGLLVEPDNAVALASAVLQLVNDPTKRREMGSRARQRVIRSFTCERMAQATLDAYRSIC